MLKVASVFLPDDSIQPEFEPGALMTSGVNRSEIISLPKRADFLRLRSGKRYSCDRFTLQARQNSELNNCRVGYTVTTKVGTAVIRNRIKRRLRAAVSEVFPKNAGVGFDYALIARRAVLTADFATIVQDLQRALDHVHMNRAKGATERTDTKISRTSKNKS